MNITDFLMTFFMTVTMINVGVNLFLKRRKLVKQTQELERTQDIILHYQLAEYNVAAWQHVNIRKEMDDACNDGW